jgi:quaternary ammonium compound-resistance protein SugE
MAWLILLLAGLLEIGWAVGLKYTDGFTRLVPSLLTGAAIVASMVLLSLAVRSIPIGTAYAIWVGIGAVGAAVLGMYLFDEPRSAGRVFFLALMIVALVGLKLTSPSEPDVLPAPAPLEQDSARR